jgi:hypothetical protein
MGYQGKSEERKGKEKKETGAPRRCLIPNPLFLMPMFPIPNFPPPEA